MDGKIIALKLVDSKGVTEEFHIQNPILCFSHIPFGYFQLREDCFLHKKHMKYSVCLFLYISSSYLILVCVEGGSPLKLSWFAWMIKSQESGCVLGPEWHALVKYATLRHFASSILLLLLFQFYNVQVFCDMLIYLQYTNSRKRLMHVGDTINSAM